MSIDVTFRPASYGDFAGPVDLAVNGISGQMRREMVRDMLTAEGEQRERYDALLGPIEPAILEERADESFVQNLSGCGGPNWLGGEYLPRRSSCEVEIARVVLASTCMDVISLRARWSGGRYRYRLVDEYGSRRQLCRKTSKRTLTLGQVIDMLDTVDGGGDLHTCGQGIVECWWYQQWECGDGPEACTDFAWVESEIYPGLADWYRERAVEWRREREAERAAKDAEEAPAAEEEEGALQPAPDTPLLEVHLPCPEGWRWVGEDEWRQEISLMDVDLERRVGASLDSLTPPMCMVAKEPRGFRGASTTVAVEQQPGGREGAPATSEEALSMALTFCVRAYDDSILVTFPEAATLGGHAGHKARVLFSQPRKDGPPLLFDCILHCVAVGDRLVQVCASTAQGASRSTWAELEEALATIRFRWVRLAAPAVCPDQERSRT
ncbi:MAG: hypothetical protein ACYC6F_02715 [Longimicrobiales bacterium]